MTSLERAVGKLLSGVDLTLAQDADESLLRKLREILLEHHGKIPVTLELKLGPRKVRINPGEAYTVRPNDALKAQVEEVLGQGSVRERYGSGPTG